MRTVREIQQDMQDAQQQLGELTKWRDQLLEVAAGSLDSDADDAQIQRLNVQIQALETRLRTLKAAHFQAAAADMLNEYQNAHQAAFDAAQRRVEARYALEALDAEYKARRQALVQEQQRAEQEASRARILADEFLKHADQRTPYGAVLVQAIEPHAREIAQQFAEMTAEAARQRRAEREAKDAPAREAAEAARLAKMEEAQQRIAERQARIAAQRGQLKFKQPPVHRAVMPQWAPEAPKEGRGI